MPTATATVSLTDAPELPSEAPATSEQQFLVDRIPPFLDGKPFYANKYGHCCNTWEPVSGTRGYECAHQRVLWRSEFGEAARRADELR